MTISSGIFAFGAAAFTYLILALQVRAGFPPFYRKFGAILEAEIKAVIPATFAMMALIVLMLATGWSVIFALFSINNYWLMLKYS